MVAERERKPIHDVTAIKWASRLFDPAIAISIGISNRSNYDFSPTLGSEHVFKVRRAKSPNSASMILVSSDRCSKLTAVDKRKI
jgi:hypothetical protein